MNVSGVERPALSNVSVKLYNSVVDLEMTYYNMRCKTDLCVEVLH